MIDLLETRTAEQHAIVFLRRISHPETEEAIKAATFTVSMKQDKTGIEPDKEKTNFRHDAGQIRGKIAKVIKDPFMRHYVALTLKSYDDFAMRLKRLPYKNPSNATKQIALLKKLRETELLINTDLIGLVTSKTCKKGEEPRLNYPEAQAAVEALSALAQRIEKDAKAQYAAGLIERPTKVDWLEECYLTLSYRLELSGKDEDEAMALAEQLTKYAFKSNLSNPATPNNYYERHRRLRTASAHLRVINGKRKPKEEVMIYAYRHIEKQSTSNP